jgi:uncharacterized LabA/DUF88 family protein
MRTALYVDGFNLYYAALRARPQYRWLDLHALAQNALDEMHEVVRIRYFTARVKGAEGDQGGPERQDAYARALVCRCPNLTVHWGRFVVRERWRRLVEPMTRSFAPCPEKVLTWHREEKGTDVSLGVHLLNDAWCDVYDCAVLVSDDSDLAEALSIVRDMGKQVVLLTPIGLQELGGGTSDGARRFPTRELLKHSHGCRHLSIKHLADSQMPDVVTNPRNGRQYRRPASWRTDDPPMIPRSNRVSEPLHTYALGPRPSLPRHFSTRRVTNR